MTNQNLKIIRCPTFDNFLDELIKASRFGLFAEGGSIYIHKTSVGYRFGSCVIILDERPMQEYQHNLLRKFFQDNPCKFAR